MTVGNRIIVAALRKVWADLANDGSLRQALIDASISLLRLIESGQVKSTSGNGHMTVFETSGGRVSVADAVEVYTYLVEEFDRAKDAIGSDDDETIMEQVITNLRPRTGATDNFMYIMK